MNLYNANQNTYISNNDMPAVARLNIIFWYMYFFMFIPLLLLDVPKGSIENEKDYTD